MVLDFAELADWKTAVEIGLPRRSVRLLLDKVLGEELDEGSDSLRCSCDALQQHLGTREAQVRECFITSEKIDHFYLVSPIGIHSVQGGEVTIHGEVDRHDIDLFTDRRTKADLVRGLRPRNENVPTSELPLQPGRADIALTELGRPSDNARDQWLGSRRHEEAIHNARVTVTADIDPRPLQRTAVSQNLDIRVLRERCRSRSLRGVHEID